MSSTPGVFAAGGVVFRVRGCCRTRFGQVPVGVSVGVRVFAVIAAAALVGPSILILAPIWILGVVIFHLLGRGRSSMLAWAIWLTTLLIIAAFYLMKYKIMN